MRKLIWISVLVFLGQGMSAFALPSVTFGNGPGTTGGGEFNAVTSAHGNFVTFCLEYNEHISYGTTFYYEISQAARYNNNGTIDPLSRPTAWLYLQYRSGTLGSFGAAYEYSSTDSDANDLQRAIWFLEGEMGGVYNYYAELAINQTGALPSVDNNGFYGVGVMNLWATDAPNWAPKQDQLILLPGGGSTVPDGGATVSLLGLAIGLVAFLSRRGQGQ